LENLGPFETGCESRSLKEAAYILSDELRNAALTGNTLPEKCTLDPMKFIRVEFLV
jgi:hypothetical protein